MTANETPWSDVVYVPDKYSQRSSALETVDQRGISIAQLRSLADDIITIVLNKKDFEKNDTGVYIGRLDKDSLDFQDVEDLFVIPLTPPDCSFVELVASESQWARYVVSFDPKAQFFSTIRKLELHAKSNGLSEEDDFYWIDVFALSAEEKASIFEKEPAIEQIPAVQVLASEGCEGTVLILDTDEFCHLPFLVQAYVTSEKGKHVDFATDVSFDNDSDESCSALVRVGLEIHEEITDYDEGRELKKENEGQDAFEDTEIQELLSISSDDFITAFRSSVENIKPKQDHNDWWIQAISGKEDIINIAVKQLFFLQVSSVAIDLCDRLLLQEIFESNLFSKHELIEFADTNHFVANASEYNYPCGTLEFLLRFGCDSNGLTKDGVTALETAWKNSNYRNLCMLLQYNCDVPPNLEGDDEALSILADFTGPVSLPNVKARLKKLWGRPDDEYYNEGEKVKVELPVSYLERGPNIPTPQRGISIRQLEEFGDYLRQKLASEDLEKRDRDGYVLESLSAENISMYEICDEFIKPLTKGCSFVELVAQEPQAPRWFVSHYWGTPFFDTLRMLKLHAKERNISQCDDYYWICTFANNQHNLEELDTEDICQTPFAKTLMSPKCEGTVMLLDEENATPFTRIWCVFELYITTVLSRETPERETGLLYDVATIIPEEECFDDNNNSNQRCAGLLLADSDDSILTSDKEATDHPGHLSTDRKAWFPQGVSILGVKTDVRKGQASMEKDRHMILSHIAGKEDEVNQTVQKKFFGSAIYSAVTDQNLPFLREVMESSIVDKETAIHIANARGCVADAAEYLFPLGTLDYLLQFGCDPNALAEDGKHPLENAVTVRGYSNVIRLLAHGSRPTYTYEDGSGLRVDEEILTILKQYDGDLDTIRAELRSRMLCNDDNDSVSPEEESTGS